MSARMAHCRRQTGFSPARLTLSTISRVRVASANSSMCLNMKMPIRIIRVIGSMDLTLPSHCIILPGLALRSDDCFDKAPTQTVMITESPAFYPYSWPQPRIAMKLPAGGAPEFNNAKDMVGFVDGQLSYFNMYFQAPGNRPSCFLRSAG